jgi:hypothetical protein
LKVLEPIEFIYMHLALTFLTKKYQIPIANILKLRFAVVGPIVKLEMAIFGVGVLAGLISWVVRFGN